MIALLLACQLGGSDTAASEDCDREPALSWENFGESYMALHCNGCHSSLLPSGQRGGAPLGMDFDTWSDVVLNVERIRSRALGDAPDMPPGGGPTETDLEMFEEWLACEVESAAEAE